MLSRGTAAPLVVALLLILPACRDTSDRPRVADLAFEGNDTFGDGDLKDVVSTRETGWLPWSRPHYFDQSVFEADLERLRMFYVDRGFPAAAVTSTDIAFNDDRSEVSLTIHLAEGEPVIVERVAVEGLGAFAPGMVEAVGNVPLQAGDRRDRLVVAESRERALFALKDRGYPDAHVETVESPGSTPSRVVVTFAARPGRSAVFGEVTVNDLENVEYAVVRRTLAFRVGDIYRESQLLESQRRLSSLGLFSFANVSRNTETPADGNTGVVPISVTVAPRKPTRWQLGVGYGSEDGPRGSTQWRHVNFFGGARQFTADARYSRRLREADIEFTQPYVATRRLALHARIGARQQNEDNFDSHSYGGRTGLIWSQQIGRGLYLQPIDHVIRLSYVNMFERYEITEETLADVTQFEELIALGFDPITGTGSGRVGGFELAFERTAVDSPIDPTRGHMGIVRLGYATPGLGGTYDFTEALADARVYVPIGRWVWASRVRAATLRADVPEAIPFSSRYFLGGSSSLRGWGRFQVAPLTEDGLPVGGDKLLEFSTELRVPLSGSFGAVAFVDAGNVWTNFTTVSREEDVGFNTLRVSIGPGLRWTSPVGIVRADLGFQLNPIDGLVINGEPERRHWRIHFSIGHAF